MTAADLRPGHVLVILPGLAFAAWARVTWTARPGPGSHQAPRVSVVGEAIAPDRGVVHAWVHAPGDPVWVTAISDHQARTRYG